MATIAPAAYGAWPGTLAGRGKPPLLDTNLQISSFGETQDGEVLVVDYGGALYRLVERRRREPVHPALLH